MTQPVLPALFLTIGLVKSFIYLGQLFFFSWIVLH